MMRKKTALDSLFTKTRAGILAATFLQPDRWWYLSELATELNTGPSSLQRELASLVAAGLLRQRRDGTRAYFRAESDSPIFGEVQGIISKTAGVEAVVDSALGKFGARIRCAFIHGSRARGEERAASDIDLIVIGSVGLADLAATLRALEKRLRREVNVTCYSPTEFRKKAVARNHFVLSVLKGKKRFLLGDADELEAIAGKSSRAAA